MNFGVLSVKMAEGVMGEGGDENRISQVTQLWV